MPLRFASETSDGKITHSQIPSKMRSITFWTNPAMFLENVE